MALLHDLVPVFVFGLFLLGVIATYHFWNIKREVQKIREHVTDEQR